MNFKFKHGDEVVVARRFSTNWCKVGDKHTVKLAKVHDGENVYVVDDYDSNVFIQECNLEFVNADPIKMRDTIIELEAYEEHFRRERDTLIECLASEGFVLIDRVNSKVDEGVRTFHPEDPHGWVVGDKLRCTASDSPRCYTVGNHYNVVKGRGGCDISIADNFGSNDESWCDFSFSEFKDYMFIKV